MRTISKISPFMCATTVAMVAVALCCSACDSHDSGSQATKPSSATLTTTSQQSDPIHETYLRVQAYVKQHPETAHYFDPQPGDAYQGPNLIENWANMLDPTGAAINAFYDDYSRFSWAVNHELGRDEFNPIPQNGIIVETAEPSATKPN